MVILSCLWFTFQFECKQICSELVKEKGNKTVMLPFFDFIYSIYQLKPKAALSNIHLAVWYNFYPKACLPLIFCTC